MRSHINMQQHLSIRGRPRVSRDMATPGTAHSCELSLQVTAAPVRALQRSAAVWTWAMATSADVPSPATTASMSSAAASGSRTVAISSLSCRPSSSPYLRIWCRSSRSICASPMTHTQERVRAHQATGSHQHRRTSANDLWPCWTHAYVAQTCTRASSA